MYKKDELSYFEVFELINKMTEGDPEYYISDIEAVQLNALKKTFQILEILVVFLFIRIVWRRIQNFASV